MTQHTNPFVPGQRVAVTQQIPHRSRVWATRITGQVIKFEQRRTGSWYAHAKGDRLWLDRLTLRKDDGEIVVCILDQYTQVALLASPPAESEAPPPPSSTPDTADPQAIATDPPEGATGDPTAHAA